MTIAELIASCEADFSSVLMDSKREGMEISSGGNDVPGDAQLRTEPAALYATEELALAAWLTEFNCSVKREGQSLIWVERPYVETYRITLGDKFNSFRVVRDRFVVRGTVAFEKYEPANKHDFGLNDTECVKCGATRNEILDNLKPVECPSEKEVPLPAEVLKPKRKAKAS